MIPAPPPISAVAGVPVSCATSGISADGRAMAGYWDGHAITLSPSVCRGLAGITIKVVTEQTVEDIVYLSHEMAHASGRDAATASALASDPGFRGETARIESRYGLDAATAALESGADCAGARDASAVAYALGLRSSAWFMVLRVLARAGAYTTVTEACLPPSGR